MHSRRERRLQALESSLSERVQSLHSQFHGHIYSQLTDIELEMIAEADNLESDSLAAVRERFYELGRAAEAEGELPIFALKVGLWALEMQKAARI